MASAVLHPTIAEASQWSDQPARTRGMFIGTPEIYFAKRIDNSRVVKVTDPKRRHEMMIFGVVLGVFFLLALTYVWQHFSSIEYGYRIEQLAAERDTLAESNRVLRLEEATLKDPERIDTIARRMGMQPPAPGQTQVIDSSFADSSAPVLAKANAISVISMQQ